MLVVGLTGSIATGKSTVSSTLAAPPYSLPVIDADVLARKVVEPGTRGYARIVQHFGPSTPDLLLPASESMPEDGPDGKGRPLNRSTLGRRVFGVTEERKRDRAVLNGIVHPAVRWEIAKAVLGSYFAGHWAVVLDAPLLLESWLHLFCGVVVVVAVGDREVQLRRLLDRNGHQLTREDAENRIDSQTNARDKAARCEAMGPGRGVVVWNDGSKEELVGKVHDAVGGLRARSPDWWSWVLLGCPPLAVTVGLWQVWTNVKTDKAWAAREISQARL